MQNDSIDNLRLDLNRKGVRGVIYVRAGDTRARTIHITLTNNGSIVDLSEAVFAELLIKKPDLNENDQTMVRYGNELQYTFRTQDINVPGECRCQVVVTFADDTIITGPEFSVMVFEKVINPEHEKSLNEYTAISQILVDVTNLKNDTEIIKNEAQSAADAAEASELNAKDSEEAAEGYRDEAKEIAEGLAGAILPQDGIITFADLANVQMTPGFMWTISDEFETDSRFIETSGILMPAGTKVFVTIHEKFACMSPVSVVGVKGDGETDYRQGNVSLTKGNIGLGNVDNTSDQNKPISSAMQAALDSINNTLGTMSTTLTNLGTTVGNLENTVGTINDTVSGLVTSVGNITDVLGYPYDPGQ